jgi:hypothetical protein
MPPARKGSAKRATASSSSGKPTAKKAAAVVVPTEDNEADPLVSAKVSALGTTMSEAVSGHEKREKREEKREEKRREHSFLPFLSFLSIRKPHL